MATPNLGIVHIAAAQNQKEVTANTAFDDLDLALTNVVTETMSGPSFSLQQTDALTNMVFHFTGALTQIGVVTIPSSRKLYIVSNQTGQALVFQAQGGRTAFVAPSATGGDSIPTIRYAVLYCDGANVDIVSGEAEAFVLDVFQAGVGTNNQVLLYKKMVRPALFPAGAIFSLAIARTAATGSTTFTFKKNGTAFATVVFAGGSAAGTFTQASDTGFNVGDIIEVDGPAVADASLANIGLSLIGYNY